jgi:hypothetical protein
MHEGPADHSFQESPGTDILTGFLRFRRSFVKITA